MLVDMLRGGPVHGQIDHAWLATQVRPALHLLVDDISAISSDSTQVVASVIVASHGDGLLGSHDHSEKEWRERLLIPAEV
jgi:hypothetical protein